MAGKYRKVNPRIWTDEGFEQLDSSGKLLALYIVTSAQSNRCGIFRYSGPKAEEETGLSPDSYATAFQRVCASLHWKYDPKRRVIYLPTWWKYNPPENPKHLLGCLEDLPDLPQTDLLNEFAHNDRYLPTHCRDDFKIAMGIAMAYQEQEQKLEQEQKSAGADAADSSPEIPSAPKKKSAPTGAHHELIKTFCDGWQQRYQAKYHFASGKDGRHIKWLLTAAEHDIAEAKRIVEAFLDDEDDFLLSRHHPLGVLVSQFNKYRGTARVPVRQAPRDRRAAAVDAALEGMQL